MKEAKSEGYDAEKPSVKPKDTVSTRRSEEIRLWNRWCLGKGSSPPMIKEEECLWEKDNEHESKEREDKCASRGERGGEVKERKKEEWKISLSPTHHAAKEAFHSLHASQKIP